MAAAGLLVMSDIWEKLQVEPFHLFLKSGGHLLCLSALLCLPSAFTGGKNVKAAPKI